ncbi:MAG: rod shape-determining protein MreC [Candidatus Sumerlaeia bacterium]|nr:rod shape-determining protein MreC [Candidatus Sumerlaeia bacterium]
MKPPVGRDLKLDLVQLPFVTSGSVQAAGCSRWKDRSPVMGLVRRKNRWKKLALPLVVVAILALSLQVLEQRHPGTDNPVNHGWASITSPFLRAGAWARGQVDVVSDAVGGARSLREENEALKAALLEQQFDAARELAQHALATIAQDVSTNIPPGSFELIHAPVLAGPSRTGRQQVWISSGTLDGVSEGMVALGPQGIVGLVSEVYERSARVILITDPLSAWGAQIVSTSDMGLLRGTGDPYIVEFQFERTAVETSPGDIVVSSGMAGSLAPAGMQFGTVEEVSWNKNGEPVARVRLPSAPERLRTLFVVPLRQLSVEASR